VEVTHLNLNDNTNEGMRHKNLPLFSVQYHPEASPGRTTRTICLRSSRSHEGMEAAGELAALVTRCAWPNQIS
jgi:hypothetical protein